jgi:uridylate kinase
MGDEMKIVITIGGSIIIKDHNYKKFMDYAEVLRDLTDEHEIFVVVGGGKTARDYIGIARDLGVSEAMCDEVGIEVTRLNAKLLIAALGEYAYPEVPHNFREALQFASSNNIVVMGGTEPAHSTDAVGSILAEFVGAELLINATSVDGLYNKDPNKYSDAEMFKEVKPSKMMDLMSTKDIKAGTYEFFDKTAIQIIKRSSIKTVILNGGNANNIKTAINGRIGTIIVPE